MFGCLSRVKFEICGRCYEGRSDGINLRNERTIVRGSESFMVLWPAGYDVGIMVIVCIIDHYALFCMNGSTL